MKTRVEAVEYTAAAFAQSKQRMINVRMNSLAELAIWHF